MNGSECDEWDWILQIRLLMWFGEPCSSYGECLIVHFVNSAIQSLANSLCAWLCFEAEDSSNASRNDITSGCSCCHELANQREIYRQSGLKSCLAIRSTSVARSKSTGNNQSNILVNS